MRNRIAILAALPLIFVAGSAIAEVTIATDKPSYEVGEIVRISAHNSGPEDEYLISAPYFVIGNEDTGACVYGCVGLPVVTTFAAGETISMERDTGLDPDEPGNYRVSVALPDGPSTTYELTVGVPAAPRTWTTLKAQYR